MAICLLCGKESEYFICKSCEAEVSPEKLCKDLLDFSPYSVNDQLWKGISDRLSDPYNLRLAAFAAADLLPSPKKEYIKICSMVGHSKEASVLSKEWFCQAYRVCTENEGLSQYELDRLRGLMLMEHLREYEYDGAEKIAEEIREHENMPPQAFLALSEYYSKTRRYDRAEEILSRMEKLYAKSSNHSANIYWLREKINKRRERNAHYMPRPISGKIRYAEFMKSLGIDVDVPKPTAKAPKPIPRDVYPDFTEKTEADFDSFTAFDFETTGISDYDEIVEVGAVKVVNGVVSEEKKFIFQEFVHPFKRRISDDITKLTGITNEDTKDARRMWEVIPDFLRFAGDDILVGFNCIAFDCKFLKRAGRYSNIIIENQVFDVRRFAMKNFREKPEFDNKTSLRSLGELLGVENPKAHRALADALTTAKIYLKLKELLPHEEDIENLFDDVDDWD